MLWAIRRRPPPRHRVLCAVLGVRRECRVQADHDAFQSVYRPGMPGVPALSDSNCTTTTLDRLHGLHSDFVVPREPPCTCPCTCTCTRTCTCCRLENHEVDVCIRSRVYQGARMLFSCRVTCNMPLGGARNDGAAAAGYPLARSFYDSEVQYACEDLCVGTDD